jgi:hypothetical protein
MKISSSRFLKEPGRKTCHKKPFKDNRRTVVALLSLLMIAAISLPNTITTPLSLFFNQEEVKASQEGTAGLKVFVDLYHNRRGSAQLCVSSTYEDLGCKTINLSQYPSPVRSGPYTFSPEMVEVGETFRVCITNLNTGGQSRCISGTNGPEKEPEYVSLTVPGQSSGSGGGITGITPPNQNQIPSQRSGIINWENLCEQAKSLHEQFIKEDCDDLAHGTQLTREGIRVILCFGAGAYLLLIDPFQFAAAQSAARAAGLCK